MSLPSILVKSTPVNPVFNDTSGAVSHKEADSPLRREYDALLARAVSNSLSGKMRKRLNEILEMMKNGSH